MVVTVDIVPGAGVQQAMLPIVHVIATTFEGTQAALVAAVPLARGANARLVIVVPRIVSCAAELDHPAAATEVMAERYRDIARSLGAQPEIEVCASIGMADFIAKICAVHGQVVVGGPVGYWLTSPEERFANRLARAGCQVAFAASGANPTQRRVAA